MYILPAIDVQQGVVVRGKAGQRDQYRPLESQLAADAQPATVAKGLAQCGFRQSYLADLDAIAGADPAWSIYEQLAVAGLSLWIDAGVCDTRRAAELMRFGERSGALATIVVGLESLSGRTAWQQICAAIDPGRLVFSLDLFAGRPLARAPEWQSAEPLSIARDVVGCGARRLLVLDLAQVGMELGVGTAGLCRDLSREFPQLEILSGGGVRGPDDLAELERAGCRGAVVASALHDGRLTPADLAAYLACAPAAVSRG